MAVAVIYMHTGHTTATAMWMAIGGGINIAKQCQAQTAHRMNAHGMNPPMSTFGQLPISANSPMIAIAGQKPV